MKTQTAGKVNYRLMQQMGVGKRKLTRPVTALTGMGIDIEKAENSENQRENRDLLNIANNFWSSLSDARERAARIRKYLKGDQWSDLVPDPDSNTEYITEEESITRQRKLPLKQNIMAQIFNNLIGRFRTNQLKPMVIAFKKVDSQLTEMLSNALRANHDLNKIKELDAQNFATFMRSGIAVCKTTYQYNEESNREDAHVENININRAFFNTDVQDIRMTDLRIIGVIHDIPLDKLISVFARTKEQEEWLRSVYSGYGTLRDYSSSTGLTADETDSLSFFVPVDLSKARMIEIWYQKSEWRTWCHDYLSGELYISKQTLAQIEAENQMRVMEASLQGVPEDEVPLIAAESKFETFWYVKYLTPWGHTLFEDETMYKHEKHPFTAIVQPLTDGESYGFLEQIIDQQRYINRLITMMDFIIGASAKGLLLFPEEMKPDDMNWDDIADEWSKFGGVIRYKAKPGVAAPQQVSSNSTNVGITEMLNIQMKLIQEISGVNYAIQGQKASSSTPASLYAQEAANSSINSKNLFDVFTNLYVEPRDNKLLKVIHQYYKEKRMLAISGDYYAEAAKMYDPEKVADLDVKVTISQTTDTPVFRQITDDILLNMLEKQLIDIETYLEHSTMPFAAALLDTVRKKQESIQNGQPAANGQLPPELQQQAQINPDVDMLIKKMMQDKAA